MAVIQYRSDDTPIISYEGCVMRTYERNGALDSDFYAECIDLESGKVVQVEYDTTRFGGCGTAKVDLTETNFRLFQRKVYAKQLEDAFTYERRSASKVEIGKVVRVVKGRKVPIGTVGTVFWQKEVNYDPYGRARGAQTRIGIKDAKGEVYWLNQANVVVDDPEMYTRSPQMLVKALKATRAKQYKKGKRIYKW